MFISEGLVAKVKCDILPGSGVDIDRFTPIENKNKNGFFKFLLVARMLWDKGVGEYVDAAKLIKEKNPDVEFQLLGFLDVENNTAISKEQMQKWIDAKYINYLGVSDDVKYEIAKADCIVLPSFYREGTPRILLESASMAKPIITTDNVGCRDVVDNGVNGFLCEVKNSKELAEKMEIMMNLTTEKRDAMGRSGRNKMIEEFDECIVIDKYVSSISEILNQ